MKKMSNTSKPIISISKYTLTDEVRQKSFIVMFILCALAILLVRGCYSGSFMVNGRALDVENVIRVVSKVIFHLIAAGSAILAALLTMRVLKRDRDEGMLACILSKPITRKQYVTGKILGLWVLSISFMFVLHFIVFVLASFNLREVMAEFLVASLLCWLNLLFVVLAVLLISLVTSDIMAFLAVMGIGIVSFVLDGIFAISRSSMGQAMMQQSGSSSDVGVWKVIYYVWPKLSGVQQFASSLIGREEPVGFVSLYSVANVLIYVLILGALLFWRFQNEDVV